VLYAPTDSVARAAARAAFGRIAQLDGDLSDYRADSEVRRIEANAGTWVNINRSTFEVLSRAIDIARRSKGAFDPTIGPLVALWRTARTTRQLPSAASIDSARALVSYERLELDAERPAARLTRAGMRLDLGGIAKGFILQEALRTLEQRRIPQALLDAGGDIVVGAAPPLQSGWRIDIPDDPDFAYRVRAIQHTAVATSGPAYQFVEIGGVRYSHVIDPRTGLGLTNGITARVMAPDGATADALATMLTVVGPDSVQALLAQFSGVTASVRRMR
jgi:thiamine biosynthesis lipoprotein